MVSTSTLSFAPFSLKVSFVVCSIMFPLSGFTVYEVAVFTMLFPSLEVTTLSFAATLTIVVVGFTITGSPTCAIASPLFGFNV